MNHLSNEVLAHLDLVPLDLDTSCLFPHTTVTIKPARGTTHAEICKNTVLYSLPFKYNLRIDQVPSNSSQMVIELVAQWESSLQQEIVANGIVMEKVLSRGKNWVEMRIAFLTQSYAYNNCHFVVRVQADGLLLFASEPFSILARKKVKHNL